LILSLDGVKSVRHPSKAETGLPSFGEKLKLEREKRKITLEEISVSTKIGTRMLQALEENKFNQLPGGIFNKGFVRAYSRCIGLDEDQTVADYLKASGDVPSVSAEIAAREDELRRQDDKDDGNDRGKARVSRLAASSDSPAHQIPWGLLAAILLLVALALLLWIRREHAHKKEALRTAPASAEAQSSGTQLSGKHLSANNADAGSASSVQATTAPSTAGSAHPAQPNEPKSAAKAVTGASTAVKNAVTAGPSVPAGEVAGMFTVVVQTREESWISITTDGKSVGSELLSVGSQRVARGRKEIIVKAGNVGGVDFLFNGKKLDIGGEFGEVKIVTFGPQGVVPNAAVPPSTP
jgi:cytoskeletal protein RodZ